MSADIKVIYNERGGGKTTEAIKLASEGFYYIVCINQKEAKRVFDIAKANGKSIPFPITFHEFLSGDFYAKGIKGFVIDNADLLLTAACGNAPLVALTLNKEVAE